MASNTHEDGQIVVSKEITVTSTPRNTHDSNNAESSTQISVLSKNDDDNAENKGVVEETLPSVNENDLSVEANENQVSPTWEYMNICDTCGDQGFKDLLVICSKCKVGAEHTYCMVVKVDVPPTEWICFDCTEDENGMPQGEGEETISMVERNADSSVDPSKMGERTLTQEPDLLSRGLNIDLNVDPNIDLNVDPNIDMNEEPSSGKRKTGPSTDSPKTAEEASSEADLLNKKRRCKVIWFDLNEEPNPDVDEDPNRDLDIDLNVDP